MGVEGKGGSEGEGRRGEWSIPRQKILGTALIFSVLFEKMKS